METVAVMSALETRISSFLSKQDLGGLDDLAQNGLFASRDPEMTNDTPQIKAKNVLTYVDAFDKRAPGFRGHYDILSERCHPNSLGHNFMFSKLDRSNGSVSFLEEREPERNGQMVFAALAVLPLVESMMSRLDDLIRKVSDFHHSVAPVGGSQPDPSVSPGV
jgi:hypothetical protein